MQAKGSGPHASGNHVQESSKAVPHGFMQCMPCLHVVVDPAAGVASHRVHQTRDMQQSTCA